MNDKTGKTLRIIAIIFMGLAAAMNLLGGIGTVCAAFLTKQFPPMWALLDYQWLYQVLMIVTIIIGIAGVWGTIILTKGKENAYRNALIILVLGTLFGAIQYFASLALRGKATPANMKFFLNAFTLLLFLVLGLPGLRDRVHFTKTDSETQSTAAGLTAIVTGLVTISVYLWAGPSHTFENSNWVLVLDGQLLGTGALLMIAGVVTLLRRKIAHQKEEQSVPVPH